MFAAEMAEMAREMAHGVADEMAEEIAEEIFNDLPPPQVTQFRLFKLS